MGRLAGREADRAAGRALDRSPVDYDEVTFDLAGGDVFVFCTDGVFEAGDAREQEFGVDAADGGREQ